MAIFGALVAALSGFMVGCAGEKARQVVLYTNADEEAVVAMQNALDAAGYKDKYTVQSYGTGELGGKLIAEGSAIEADLVTMSTYFIESAQSKNKMFAKLSSDVPKATLAPGDYYAPILANTGALFVNTEVMRQKNLPMPTGIKDLTNPAYANMVSIPNIASSSTAWLMVQAVIETYGDDEAKRTLRDLAANCGPHIEKSGSGPIKKVRAGEVAIGFGLRHQAVADQSAGKPIACIDPTEGNYTLTESIAVVSKKGPTADLAQKMAAIIVKEARKDLISIYPVALYAGEAVESRNVPAYPKTLGQPMTVDLLNAHITLFNEAIQ